jgi:hypothetical protein
MRLRLTPRSANGSTAPTFSRPGRPSRSSTLCGLLSRTRSWCVPLHNLSLVRWCADKPPSSPLSDHPLYRRRHLARSRSLPGSRHCSRNRLQRRDWPGAGGSFGRLGRGCRHHGRCPHRRHGRKCQRRSSIPLASMASSLLISIVSPRPCSSKRRSNSRSSTRRRTIEASRSSDPVKNKLSAST